MLQGFDMVSELIEGTEAFLEEHGFDSVQAAVGQSLPFFTTHHHLVELQAEKRAAKAAAKEAKEAKANQVNRDTDWGKGEITDQTRNLVSNE